MRNNINVPGGIQTRNLSNLAVADLHLKLQGHWDQLYIYIFCISLCVELFSVMGLFPSVFGYVLGYLLLV